MQVSPTTPAGFRTNTTPYGSPLRALNPLTVTLGITNASFVAQVVEWMPELLYDIIRQAFHHDGMSFIRILQRCPHFMPNLFQSLMSDPKNIMLLRHKNGMQVSDAMAKLYPTHEEHDPADIHRAREIAEREDKVPVGILYRNPAIERYDEARRPQRVPSWEQNRSALEELFDKHGIFPRPGNGRKGNGHGEG
jgi:2-oxoglutarate ferredoxin oxidoreductase subunit beta